MSKDSYVTYKICQLKQDHIYTIINHHKVCYICIKITIKGDNNHMVSKMAHAKNLGEPFMAHLENLHNIPWLCMALSENIIPY